MAAFAMETFSLVMLFSLPLAGACALLVGGICYLTARIHKSAPVITAIVLHISAVFGVIDYYRSYHEMFIASVIMAYGVTIGSLVSAVLGARHWLRQNELEARARNSETGQRNA
jgi:hypothetical protein